MVRITLDQIVAVLGLSLALAVFSVLTKYGAPEKIRWGAAILSILVVAIFWSAVQLGADDEDD